MERYTLHARAEFECFKMLFVRSTRLLSCGARQCGADRVTMFLLRLHMDFVRRLLYHGFQIHAPRLHPIHHPDLSSLCRMAVPYHGVCHQTVSYLPQVATAVALGRRRY